MKRPLDMNHTQAGFSLLEILVSLMVLAISYSAIIQTMSAASRQAVTTENILQSVQLANRLHAEIQSGMHTATEGTDEASGLSWRVQEFQRSDVSGSDASGVRMIALQIHKPGLPNRVSEFRFLFRRVVFP